MSAVIDPYLFFPGKAEEAITFYRQVFGGEVEIDPARRCRSQCLRE